MVCAMSTSSRGGSFELRGVAVDYGTLRVLEGLDLSVAPGEAVAIVGPSGAGKSTLLRLLNGTVFPAEGQVLVDGRDLAKLTTRELRALRSHIGLVHQNLNLVPNLRVIQNVVAGKVGQRGLLASLRSMVRASAGDRLAAYELLERVGIPEKLFERTDRLSGGQTQRVALARALFQDPRALLADEPVASVDVARARDIVALMLALAREEDLTLVVSLHDLTIAREFFPRTVGLRAGRVAFDAPTAEVPDDAFEELFELEGA